MGQEIPRPGGQPPRWQDERLIAALDDAIRSADTPGTVGEIRATFGWAIAPEDADDGEGLVARADARLIQRKRDRKAASATPHLGSNA